MTELGYAYERYNWALQEMNSALAWPQCNSVYTEMFRTDSTVQSIFYAITLPIRRVGWRVDPNGADPKTVARVAEDLRLPVLGDDSHRPIPSSAGRVSWSKHLEELLMSLIYGHAFFEQVYEPDENGEEHLVKLARRLPGSITKINVARDGGLESIEQRGIDGKSEVVIPVDRLVAYCHNPIDSSWQGTSILRAAYKNYMLANELMQLEVVVLDRNGMGVPVYKPSAEYLHDEHAKEDMERGKRIVESIRHGRAAGVVPAPGANFTIEGVKGQLVSPRPAIEAHTAAIGKAVLAHFLNLDGKGGSYALAETQANLFIQSLQTKAEWISDVASQHIVEDLVRIAFPDYSGPMPRIICDPIASKKELTAEALSMLVNSGVILPDRDLEEEVRRRFTLPGKRPLEKAKEKAKEVTTTAATKAENLISELKTNPGKLTRVFNFLRGEET